MIRDDQEECKYSVLFWMEVDRFSMETQSISKFFQDAICTVFLNFQFMRIVFLALQGLVDSSCLLKNPNIK